MRRSRRHSLLYVVYLRSPLWRLRRRVWIVRARGRCQDCGSRRRLTIHHRTYERLGHEHRADVKVLCWDCHRRHHAGDPWRYSRPRLPTRIRDRARERRLTTLGVGRASFRLLALMTLIALPTLVHAVLVMVKQ
jgi:hypothetical protein